MSTEITTAQLDKFFENLAKTSNASKSAEIAEISRAYVYKLRKTDAEFARRWDEATGELAERVLDAVVDEAITGTPVLDENGRVVGARRNTRLLDRLATRVGVLDPERPSVAIQNNVNAQQAAPAATLAAEEERLHEIAVREMQKSLSDRSVATIPANILNDPDEDII